jgi:hypothetical protein
MKKIIFALSLLLAAQASAGEREGGGGSECKARFMAMTKNLESLFAGNAELQKKYPYWKQLLNVPNPTTNPNFRIKVSDGPIENCPMTAHALACGRVKENVVEMNCGTNGWNALPQQDQYKTLLHELFWWTQIDDSNYYYSIDLAKDLNQAITKNNVQVLKNFRKADIRSVETTFDGVTCGIDDRDSYRFDDGGNNCIPDPNYPDSKCVVYPRLQYSLIINGQYVYTETALYKSSASVKVQNGENITDPDVVKKCQIAMAKQSAISKDIDIDYYKIFSEKYLTFFDEVSNATVDKDYNKKCTIPYAEVIYDKSTFLVQSILTAEETIKCP